MKDFLIIGNLNAVTYKQVFPLIKDGQVKLGASIHSGDRPFEVREDYPLRSAGFYVDADERRYIRVNGVRWFTTLPTKDYPPIILTKHYNPADYPKYDNYNAIEVSRTKDIPRDYYGVMGVPISFLDKWCPEQFEIVDAENQPEVGGAMIYKRLIIRRIGACARVSYLTGDKRTDASSSASANKPTICVTSRK